MNAGIETLSAVALGGAIGAVLRYLVTHLGNRRVPWGTLFVNLTGSAALGVLLPLQGDLPEWLWYGLTAGVCGALTTFSTCMVEAGQWIRAGLWLRAVAYVVATFGGGMSLILLALKLS